jgi:hypothetical protein
MPSALGRAIASAARSVLKDLPTTPPRAAPRAPTLPHVRDTFTPAVGSGAAANGTEKQFMKTSNGTAVVSQREAGDFYCEHTAWTLNTEANKPGSSIAKDATGKPLAGFLHLPGALDQLGPKRHNATQEVIGAAFRGDVDAIRAGNPKTNPVKLLITGYGPFSTITNNPTGDFVSHGKNIDAAMKAGFGKALEGPGKKLHTAAGDVLEYRVKDAKTGKPFTVQVMAKQLDVADSAIDGGPKSVQSLLKTFKPQGAISMGIDPDAKSYEAVVRADSGGLTKGADGKMRHDDDAMVHDENGNAVESKKGEIFNDALGRAIAAGNAARSH